MSEPDPKELFDRFRFLSGLSKASQTSYLEALELTDPSMVNALEELLASAINFKDDDTLRHRISEVIGKVSRMVDQVSPDLRNLLAHEPALENYQFIRKIGEGGMGEVFLVAHKTIGRRAVVKMTKSLPLAGPLNDEALLAEARVIGNLNHRGIVTLFDAQLVETKMVLIMEHVDGETLKSILATGPPEMKDFFEMVVPIVAALAYAHDQGVIHRDVKPSNIMITKEGRPKILDFGLAKISQRPVATNAMVNKNPTTLAFKGTMAYMAPELLRGDPATPASDIYAMGIIMVEWLTGGKPFCGQTVCDLLNAMRCADNELGPRLKNKVNKPLTKLIMRCLAYDVVDRFSNGQQLYQALIAARHRSQRPGMRRRHWLGLAGATAVSLLAVYEAWKRIRPNTSFDFIWDQECPKKTNTFSRTLRWGIFADEGVPPWLVQLAKEWLLLALCQLPLALASVTLSQIAQTHQAAFGELQKPLTSRDSAWLIHLGVQSEGFYTLDTTYTKSGGLIKSSDFLNFSMGQTLARHLDNLLNWVKAKLGIQATIIPWHLWKIEEMTLHDYFQGKWFKSVDDPNNARIHLLRAFERSPDFFWAGFSLSQVYSALAQKKDAWELAKKLEKNHNFSPGERALILGHFYTESLDYRKAQDHYKAMLNNGTVPKIDGYRQLVHCYCELGHFPGAMCQVSYACRLQPENSDNFALGCFVLVESGRFEEAIINGNACIRRFGNSPMFSWILGLAHVGLGELASAQGKFAMMKHAEDAFFAALAAECMATIAMVQGLWNEAQVTLEESLAITQKGRYVDLWCKRLIWLSRLALLQGKPEESRHYLSRLNWQHLDAIPPHFRILRAAGLVYAELKDEQNVNQILEKLRLIGSQSGAEQVLAGPQLLESVAAFLNDQMPSFLILATIEAADQAWSDVWSQWYLANGQAQLGVSGAKTIYQSLATAKRGHILYREFPGLLFLVNQKL